MITAGSKVERWATKMLPSMMRAWYLPVGGQLSRVTPCRSRQKYFSQLLSAARIRLSGMAPSTCRTARQDSRGYDTAEGRQH